jgi:hypothetical protein
MNQRRSNLLFVWIGSIAVSVFAVMGSDYIGRSADCQPGQIDGQCGLSTFYWSVYGIMAGAVIFLLYDGVRLYQRISTPPRQRVPDISLW